VRVLKALCVSRKGFREMGVIIEIADDGSKANQYKIPGGFH
jgi:hypothetical protein